MHEHTSRIRDFINQPRRQYHLLKNKPLWFQLCSSLDVIEDTDLAIASYEGEEPRTSDGARYLAVYGLLQALFLQQDAVFNLCEALSIPERIDAYPRLKEIRELRHASIGHPTKKDRPQPTSYHSISRPTLTPDAFDLLSQYADGRSELSSVSIPDVIADQQRYVDDILAAVVSKLQQDDAAHKRKFRMEKLASLFPRTLAYSLEKISEGTGRPESAPLAAAGLQEVRRTLNSFEEALESRGLALDTYDSVKYTYELLEYPLRQLERLFERIRTGERRNINDKTAYIFADFLRARIADLKDMAEEIDADYSS